MQLPAPDMLVISLGTTPGLRRADAAFAESVEAAGASCEVVSVDVGLLGRLRRVQPLIDLIEAQAARRTAITVLKRFTPRAVVFSTVTASLSQPRWVWRNFRTAVRFDCPAALNRPGARNFIQHRLEARALARTDLPLPTGEAAAAAADLGNSRVLPVPLDERFFAAGSDASRTRKARQAVAYGGGPRKRGLDLLCRAWQAARVEGPRLYVVGIDAAAATEFLAARGVPVPAGVEFVGTLVPQALADLIADSQVFVNAASWDDYGMTQLEALAAGAVLATSPTPGPYEALPIARRLAPQMVAGDMSSETLAVAIRQGFDLGDQELVAYRRAAAAALAGYRPAAVQARLRDEILPLLLAA